MADENKGIEPQADDDDAADLAAEPSIDGLLKRLGDFLPGMEGWKDVKDPEAAMHRQRSEQAAALKKSANDFRDCFMTPAGRKVLEHLLDTTLRARPYPPEAMLSMKQITPLLIAHDANCNFVWAIFEAIAQAENAKIQPRSFT